MQNGRKGAARKVSAGFVEKPRPLGKNYTAPALEQQWTVRGGRRGFGAGKRKKELHWFWNGKLPHCSRGNNIRWTANDKGHVGGVLLTTQSFRTRRTGAKRKRRAIKKVSRRNDREVIEGDFGGKRKKQGSG